MKQWKLVLVALLAVLLVCISVTALAEGECTHEKTEDVYTGKVIWAYESSWQHKVIREVETRCVNCDKVLATKAEEELQDCTKVHVVTKDPTCTEKGTDYVYCEVCGFEGAENELEALGHKTGKQVKETAAECGKDGNIAYYTCERCGKNFDTENPDASATPLANVVIKMPAAEHTWSDVATVDPAPTCTEDGKATYVCVTCGKERTETLKALGHEYDDTKWTTTIEATCLLDGTEVNDCLRCGEDGRIYRTIEKTGHKWAVTADSLKDKADGDKEDGKYEVIKAATCTEDGNGYIFCENCKAINAVVIPAKGHTWSDWEVKQYEEDLTDDTVCEPGKYATRKCTVDGCKAEETKHVADTLYHVIDNTEGTDATCTEDGLLKGKCIVCGKEVETVVPAYGHEYEWIVVSEPSKDGDGVEELTCIWCGDVADVRVTPYTDMRYGTTITSFGPCTRDLIGGKTWNRVTPIDLSVEGTFTYPLIASNEFNVGTMTVTIKDGKATVSYKLNSTQIKVKSESLVIFNNLEALRAGTGVAAAINAPVEVAQFEDGKVIIALKLVADYNAVGAGVRDFSADASQISAMTGIID